MSVTALSPLSQVTPSSVASSGVRDVAPVQDGEDFMSVLGSMISGVNHDLQKAEAMSISAIRGDPGVQVQDVVGAVMEADQSLRMAVAVRDKIVSAYLDLSRMQI